MAAKYFQQFESCTDINWTCIQVKGQRRITFDQFVNALGIIAEKKGQPLKDTVQLVLQAGGPSVSGTKAGFVKFHDDKVSTAFSIHRNASGTSQLVTDTTYYRRKCHTIPIIDMYI